MLNDGENFYNGVTLIIFCNIGKIGQIKKIVSTFLLLDYIINSIATTVEACDSKGIITIAMSNGFPGSKKIQIVRDGGGYS